MGYADVWAQLRALAALLRAPVYSELLSSLMNYTSDALHWQGGLSGSQPALQQLFASRTSAA